MTFTVSGRKLFLVMTGGATGSLLRWSIAEGTVGLVNDFPWPTLAINLLGCLLLGYLTGYARQREAEELRLFVGVGALGGFTTFSTFGVETIRLLQSELTVVALGYLVSTTVGCLLLALLGQFLAERFTRPQAHLVPDGDGTGVVE